MRNETMIAKRLLRIAKELANDANGNGVDDEAEANRLLRQFDRDIDTFVDGVERAVEHAEHAKERTSSFSRHARHPFRRIDARRTASLVKKDYVAFVSSMDGIRTAGKGDAILSGVVQMLGSTFKFMLDCLQVLLTDVLPLGLKAMSIVIKGVLVTTGRLSKRLVKAIGPVAKKEIDELCGSLRKRLEMMDGKLSDYGKKEDGIERRLDGETDADRKKMLRKDMEDLQKDVKSDMREFIMKIATMFGDKSDAFVKKVAPVLGDD